jgi:hypothetical protein
MVTTPPCTENGFTGCSDFNGDQTFCEAAGCTYGGGPCTGTKKACASFSTSECPSIVCDGGGIPTCGGAATPCDQLTDAVACGAQDGCVWQ